MNNFGFQALRERKNDFNTKIMLETCSAMSNYPWDTISWRQSTYWDAYVSKPQNIHHKRINVAVSSTLFFLLQLAYEPAELEVQANFCVQLAKISMSQ